MFIFVLYFFGRATLATKTTQKRPSSSRIVVIASIDFEMAQEKKQLRRSSLDQNSLHIITTGNSGHRLKQVCCLVEPMKCLSAGKLASIWAPRMFEQREKRVTIFCLKLIYAKQKKSDTNPPKGSYSVGLYRPHWQAKKMTLFAQHESLLLSSLYVYSNY